MRETTSTSVVWPRMGNAFNLSALLLDTHIERGRGERVAARYEGRDISYAELAALTERTASVLRECGVERGERVAMLLRDDPDFIACFLGAVRIGAVAVPLNTLLPSAESL